MVVEDSHGKGWGPDGEFLSTYSVVSPKLLHYHAVNFTITDDYGLYITFTGKFNDTNTVQC